MGIFAIVLLAFGFLTTGLTREHVCSGVTCIKGGGVLAVIVSYFGSHYNFNYLVFTAFLTFISCFKRVYVKTQLLGNLIKLVESSD